MTTKELPRIEMIVEARRQYVQERKALTPIEAVRALASLQKRPQPILSAISASADEKAAVTLIGQVNAYTGDATETREAARQLAENGVDAVSVLTDLEIEAHSLDRLVAVTGEVSLPVISQDVIVDEYQVVEARAAGASGLVLRSSILEPIPLRALVSATQRNRMTAIVEVSTLAELEQAIMISPYVIALSTIDPLTGEPVSTPLEEMRTLIPPHIHVMLAERLGTLDEVEIAAMLKVDAVLIADNLLLDPYYATELHALLRR
jgi:indole-3-glycerol phosphate synthase